MTSRSQNTNKRSVLDILEVGVQTREVSAWVENKRSVVDIWSWSRSVDVLWTANTNIYVLGNKVSYKLKVVYEVTV